MHPAPERIILDVAEIGEKLPALLAAMAGKPFRFSIRQNGIPIADVSPYRDPLQADPKLRPLYIAPNAFGPTTDDEWPEDCR